MELSDLYPAGTPLCEVAPEFRGMSLRRWQWKKLIEQRIELARRQPKINPEDAPLSQKAVWTPRDDYGMKGI
jgi:hypothetical protein